MKLKNLIWLALLQAAFLATRSLATEGMLTHASNYRTAVVIDSYGYLWCTGLGTIRIFQTYAEPYVTFELSSSDGVEFSQYLGAYPDGPTQSFDPDTYQLYIAQPYWNNCWSEYTSWIQSHFCQYAPDTVYTAIGYVFEGYPVRAALTSRSTPEFSGSFYY
jgi:hypothetical protein